jgi:hypothetical protein
MLIIVIAVFSMLSSPRKRGPTVPQTTIFGLWIPACAGMTCHIVAGAFGNNAESAHRSTVARMNAQMDSICSRSSTPRHGGIWVLPLSTELTKRS